MTEKELDEETKKTTLPDIPTTWERFAVLIVFAAMSALMVMKGNDEAAIGFLTGIATYFLSRTGA